MQVMKTTVLCSPHNNLAGRTQRESRRKPNFSSCFSIMPTDVCQRFRHAASVSGITYRRLIFYGIQRQLVVEIASRTDASPRQSVQQHTREAVGNCRTELWEQGARRMPTWTYHDLPRQNVLNCAELRCISSVLAKQTGVGTV